MMHSSEPKDKISIHRIESLDEFSALKDEWEGLFLENRAQSLFTSWAWLFSWRQIYGEQGDLWLLVARENGTLVGVAPLMLEKRAYGIFHLRILKSLGAPKIDVGGWLLKGDRPDIASHFFAYIQSQRPHQWDILEFSEFPQDHWERIKEAMPLELRQSKRIEIVKGHYYLPAQGNWDAYYNKLSRKFRKNLRRSIRNADKLGSVDFRHYIGPQVTDKELEQIVAINRHAHYPRLANSAREQLFHKALIRNMGRTGWMAVFLLILNDAPVAYEYGFIYNGRFEDWRAGFDMRIAPTISIGKLLSLKIAEYAFEHGLREIDFMRGNEVYKQDWQPLTRHYVNVRVFSRHSMVAKLIYFWLRSVKPLLKKMRE